MMRDAGLFFSHVINARIMRHYERLVSETADLIDWNFAYNPGGKAAPAVSFDYVPSQYALPRRHEAMVGNKGVQGGYMDVAIIPCVLSAAAEQVWVMEYDVDYAGNWRDLFSRLGPIEADLMTTIVRTRAQRPGWMWWKSAAFPDFVEESALWSSFNPFMRLSRDFAVKYRDMVNGSDWVGHYEWTLPTVACVTSSRIVDIGDVGAFTPPSLQRQVYNHATFRWRPHSSHYFGERPEDFSAHPDRLHHPIKADVRSWA